MTESRSRSLAKAVSYRAVSSLLTGTIFFGATQRVRMAVALALIDSIVKVGVFYLHERAWTKSLLVKSNRNRPASSPLRFKSHDLSNPEEQLEAQKFAVETTTAQFQVR